MPELGNLNSNTGVGVRSSFLAIEDDSKTEMYARLNDAFNTVRMVAEETLSSEAVVRGFCKGVANDCATIGEKIQSIEDGIKNGNVEDALSQLAVLRKAMTVIAPSSVFVPDDKERDEMVRSFPNLELAGKAVSAGPVAAPQMIHDKKASMLEKEAFDAIANILVSNEFLSDLLADENDPYKARAEKFLNALQLLTVTNPESFNGRRWFKGDTLTGEQREQIKAIKRKLGDALDKAAPDWDLHFEANQSLASIVKWFGKSGEEEMLPGVKLEKSDMEYHLSEIRRGAEGNKNVFCSMRQAASVIARGLYYGNDEVMQSFESLFPQVMDRESIDITGLRWYGGGELTLRDMVRINRIPLLIEKALDRLHGDRNWVEDPKFDRVVQLLLDE